MKQDNPKSLSYSKLLSPIK